SRGLSPSRLTGVLQAPAGRSQGGGVARHRIRRLWRRSCTLQPDRERAPHPPGNPRYTRNVSQGWFTLKRIKPTSSSSVPLLRPVHKSTTLANVCYDIRGPVMARSRQMEEEGHRIIKL